MTSIVSDRLVCGNCIQILDVNDATGRKNACAFRHCLVSKSDTFCTNFSWNGLVESSKQLLRFPRVKPSRAAIRP